MKQEVKEYVTSLLSEGFHTAFRKIGQSRHSKEIWHHISAMPNGEWDAIVDFAFDGIKDYIDSGKVEQSIAHDKESVAKARSH